MRAHLSNFRRSNTCARSWLAESSTSWTKCRPLCRYCCWLLKNQVQVSGSAAAAHRLVETNTLTYSLHALTWTPASTVFCVIYRGLLKTWHLTRRRGEKKSCSLLYCFLKIDQSRATFCVSSSSSLLYRHFSLSHNGRYVQSCVVIRIQCAHRLYHREKNPRACMTPLLWECNQIYGHVASWLIRHRVSESTLLFFKLVPV